MLAESASSLAQLRSRPHWRIRLSWLMSKIWSSSKSRPLESPSGSAGVTKLRSERRNAAATFFTKSVFTSATSAILHVLLHDESAAMKIAAINSLDLSKYDDTKERDLLSEILKDRSLNDENNYIRIKAKAALQEANQ